MTKRIDTSSQDQPRPSSSFQWVTTTHPEQFKDKVKMKEVRRGVMMDYLQRAEQDPNSTDRRILNKRSGSNGKKKRATKSREESSSAAQPTFKVEPGISPSAAGIPSHRRLPSIPSRPAFSPDITGLDSYASAVGPPTPSSLTRGSSHKGWSRSMTPSSSTSSVTDDEHSLAAHRDLSESFTSIGSHFSDLYSNAPSSSATPHSIGTPELTAGEFPFAETDIFPIESFMQSFGSSVKHSRARSNSAPEQASEQTKLVNYMKHDIWIDDMTERNELYQQLGRFAGVLARDRPMMVSDEGLHFSLYQVNLKMMGGGSECTTVFQKGIAGVVEARGGLITMDCDHDLAAKLTITHLISSLVRCSRPEQKYLDFANVLIRRAVNHSLALSYCPLYAWKATQSVESGNPSRFSAEITKLLLETRDLITLCTNSDPPETEVHDILRKVLQSPSGDQRGHADSGDPMYESVRLATFLSAHAAMKRIPLHEAAAAPIDKSGVALDSAQEQSAASSGGGSTSSSPTESRKAGAGRPATSARKSKGKQRVKLDNTRSGVTAAMLEDRVRMLPAVGDIVSGTDLSHRGQDPMDRLAVLGVIFWISLVGIASCKPPTQKQNNDLANCRPGITSNPRTLVRTNSLDSLASYAASASPNTDLRRDSIFPLYAASYGPSTWQAEQYPFLPSDGRSGYDTPALSDYNPSQSAYPTLQTYHDDDDDATQSSSPRHEVQGASRTFFTSLAIRTAALIRKQDSAAVLRRLERFVGFLAFLNSERDVRE